MLAQSSEIEIWKETEGVIEKDGGGGEGRGDEGRGGEGRAGKARQGSEEEGGACELRPLVCFTAGIRKRNAGPARPFFVTTRRLKLDDAVCVL